MTFRPIAFVVACLSFGVVTSAQATASGATVKKLKDVVIYRDDTFYSAFPSIVRRPDGELLVAFRRAPDARSFSDSAKVTHTDPSSQLVLVRSTDNGETWTKKTQLIFAHPRGGLQDPCMVQLNDHSILCASYGWALIPKDAGQNLKNPFRHGDFVFMGGTMYRSDDGAKSWDEIPLPPTRGEERLDPFNRPVPAYNRGAMCQGKDGRLFWVTAMENPGNPKVTGTHLLISDDRGRTWNYACPVATDEKVTFNETSIYETPKGDLVAFLRTGNFDDHTAIARSTDGGKSFAKWEDAGFQGHPHYALRLPDNRVLLVYGYRHKPFGIRARVLNAECTDFKTAREIILRDDGGGFDLGYPWATMLSDDRALVVYYFNENDGPRYIAGTLLSIERGK
jgi:sialidase-1